MADNVAITAGAGTNIATDDVSGVHYQRVKLVDGTLDGTDAIPGTAANGLDVDVTRVPTDPFGANADAASSSGSISAKLRQIATNGIPDLEALTDDSAFTVGASKVEPVGFLADDASPDGADEGDCVAARTTLDRKQIVAIGESGANLVRGGGNKTDTTDQSIMSAVASKYNYLTWIAVYNSSSTNTYVNVKDGSTVVAVIPLPAYGGAVLNLTTPIRSTVNTAINLACGASVTTASLYGGGYVGL